MGKSKKVKKAAMPNSILSSGNTIAQGQKEDLDNSLDDALIIDLIKIDVKVYEKSKVSDIVNIKINGNELLVSSIHGRIGNIPPHYEKAVKEKQFFNGRIIQLGEKPLSVTVYLSE